MCENPRYAPSELRWGDSLVNLIGDHAKRQGLNGRNSLFLRLPISHNAGKSSNFSDPTAIRLLIGFDLIAEMGRLVWPTAWIPLSANWCG
jgi:hypothetical protein